MKSIIRSLFDGEISPAEYATPRTDSYRKLLTDEKDTKETLEKMLTPDQFKQVKLLVNTKDEITYQQYACIYGEGVRFGVRLMVEVYGADEDALPVLPWMKNKHVD